MRNYKQLIFNALKNVISEPGYKNMHEVTLCHRLAFHLENSSKFTGYLIDCEYDRDGDGDTLKTNPEDCEFRPDIIVHIRGKGENNNLIMIEAKKDPCSQRKKEEEIERLIGNANKYRYTHAFLVVFPQDDVKDDSVIEVKLEH